MSRRAVPKANCPAVRSAAPPDPLADTTSTATRPLFARLMTGTGCIKDLLLGDQMKVEGSTIALPRFVGLIEKAPRSFAIITPPG